MALVRSDLGGWVWSLTQPVFSTLKRLLAPSWWVVVMLTQDNMWEVCKSFLCVSLLCALPCPEAYSEVISCFFSVFTENLLCPQEQPDWWPQGSLLGTCVLIPRSQPERPGWGGFLHLPSESVYSFMIISPSSISKVHCIHSRIEAHLGIDFP